MIYLRMSITAYCLHDDLYCLIRDKEKYQDNFSFTLQQFAKVYIMLHLKVSTVFSFYQNMFNKGELNAAFVSGSCHSTF